MEYECEECCGRCRHHKKDGGDWCCDNSQSDCYGCVTEYRDICDDFEDKDEGVRAYGWPK